VNKIDAATVVVIRMNSGDELLAIFHGEAEGRIKLEHPHYVKLAADQDTLMMMPYCVFSDEKFFEIWRVHTLFVATASDDIARKFFRMINEIERKNTRTVVEASKVLDRLEAMIAENNYVDGNETKH
jgi:hypothetical protein